MATTLDAGPAAVSTRFTLLSHGEPAGFSDLLTYDPEMCAASGRLVPGPAWGRVRAVYRATPAPRARVGVAEIKSYRAEWDDFVAWAAELRRSLGFALVDEAGRPVATAHTEVQERADGQLELVVGLARPEEWLATYGAPYQVPPLDDVAPPS